MTVSNGADFFQRSLKVAQMLHAPSALLLLVLVSMPVWRSSGSATLALLKGLPVLLAAMGCFAVNDAHDYEQDCVNKPYRAIPSGAVSRRAALIAGVCLEVAAATVALLVADGPVEAAIYLAIVVGSGAYSPLLKVLGPVKGLYTAAFIALPFAMALRFSTADVAGWAYCAAVVLYCAAKELLMDIWDRDGDRQAGLRTLPVLVDVRVCRALVAVGQVLAVALMLLSGAGLLPVVLACLAIALIDALALIDRPATRRAAMYLSWLPVVALALPVVFG